MIALAVALAVVVGISLGLLGGGGSILMVPLLTIVAGMDAGCSIHTPWGKLNNASKGGSHGW